jgi:hypothetical protein
MAPHAQSFEDVFGLNLSRQKLSMKEFELVESIR